MTVLRGETIAPASEMADAVWIPPGTEEGGSDVRAETGKKEEEQRRVRPERGAGVRPEIAQKFTRVHVGETEAGYYVGED